MVSIMCYKCGSKNHKSENCPNSSHREQIQQQQVCSTLESSKYSSSESFDEELNMHMNVCNSTDSEICKCESRAESESYYDEDFASKPKEKVLMAQTIDDAETKLLAQIRTLREGELKEKLLETFLSTMHKKQGHCSKSSSKIEFKALFIDASFERNTRVFQRSQNF